MSRRSMRDEWLAAGFAMADLAGYRMQVDPAALGVPEPAPVADPAAPPAVPAPVTADGFESLPESWQKTIKDLRAENAGYRTSKDDVWDGYDDDTAGLLKGFVTGAKADPQAALSSLLRDGYGLDPAQIEALLNDPAADSAAGAAGGAGDGDRPLTVAEYQRIQADEKRASETERFVVQVETEAKGLGYTPDAKAGTPEAWAYNRVLYLAAHHAGNDLATAHKMFEAEQTAAFEAWRTKQLAAAAAQPAGGGGQGVGAGAGADPPKTMEEARLRARARMQASQSQ